jgi:competence protein ComEC
MLWKRFRISIIVFLSVSAAVFGWYLVYLAKDFRMTKVVFLNVGQGDAILISQGKNQLLIDGGRGGATLLSHLGRYVPFWDHTIEVVIATHPDSDHIGGLADLFRKYRVDMFISTAAESASDAYASLKTVVARSPGTRRIVEKKDMLISFPRGGKLEFLFPEDGNSVTAGESNEGSIVSRFSYGDTSFLLTGDLPHEESFFPEVPETDVLKLAHHGSKYSSSETFLARVHPREAVVSVGKNMYGHPAEETLTRVRSVGARLRRTDTDGDIVYRCLPDVLRCAFVSY